MYVSCGFIRLNVDQHLEPARESKNPFGIALERHVHYHMMCFCRIDSFDIQKQLFMLYLVLLNVLYT